MQHARVLIAGCGYVGTALAQGLAGQGHAVWALRRGPANWPTGVDGIAADLTDPSALRDLPPKLGYVFYTAAAPQRSDESYHQAYVVGLANLLAALEQQHQAVRRVLFTSSTAVYAQSSGEWVDERSATEPTEFAGLRMLEAEQLLRYCPFDHVVLRLGGIYGPGRTRLIDQVRRGEAALSLGPPRYTNRIHRDDAAAALVHLMGLPQPDGLYLGVDHDPVDVSEVYRWLADALGLPPPPIAAAPAERPAAANKRCRNARLLATGFGFRYPTFREGYSALLADTSRE